jgi:hypothetical protein
MNVPKYVTTFRHYKCLNIQELGLFKKERKKEEKERFPKCKQNMTNNLTTCYV